MSKYFQLELITPAASEAFAEIEAANFTTEAGQVTLLAQHQPMVLLVNAGLLTLKLANSQVKTYQISRGFCQIDANNLVKMLLNKLDAKTNL